MKSGESGRKGPPLALPLVVQVFEGANLAYIAVDSDFSVTDARLQCDNAPPRAACKTAWV